MPSGTSGLCVKLIGTACKSLTWLPSKTVGAKQTQNFLHLTLDKTLKLGYIIGMIKIEKNENFKGFLNIFVGGFLFDQVKSRAEALKIAKKLAKSRKEDGFSFLGFPMLTKEK